MAEQAAVGTGMSAVRALRTSPIQAPEPVLLPPDVPYDTKTATQIKSFYRFQRKKPEQYKKGEDGSLNI